MNKAKLKKLLAETTGCTIQHDGWTCGTCFFAVSKKLNNQDWQNVLAIRGDYPLEDLGNLPQNREASYNKIVKLCGERLKKVKR